MHETRLRNRVDKRTSSRRTAILSLGEDMPPSGRRGRSSLKPPGGSHWSAPPPGRLDPPRLSECAVFVRNSHAVNGPFQSPAKPHPWPHLQLRLRTHGHASVVYGSSHR